MHKMQSIKRQQTASVRRRLFHFRKFRSNNNNENGIPTINGDEMKTKRKEKKEEEEKNSMINAPQLTKRHLVIELLEIRLLNRPLGGLVIHFGFASSD